MEEEADQLLAFLDVLVSRQSGELQTTTCRKATNNSQILHYGSNHPVAHISKVDQHHLLEYQHPEQSGFTPKRSTIDHILTLRVLTERKREFRQELLAACVDLCKAFNSVNQDALWRILGLRGVPPKLINLMSELYSGTESAVRCGDSISDLFPVVTGVCQGCGLAPHFSALV